MWLCEEVSLVHLRRLLDWRFEGYFFCTTSPTLITCLVDNSHSSRYEMVSQFSFDLHFPNTNEVEHLYVFLGEVSVCLLYTSDAADDWLVV